MPNIPNIPDARYTFDFVAFPHLLFDKHGKALIAAIIDQKGEIIAKLMNDLYRDVSKGTKQEVKDDIFTEQDFDVFYGRLDEKGTALISIKMPDDTCDSIICLRHLIVFDIKKMKPRLFTVEKSAPSALGFVKNFMKGEDKPLKNFLCEVKSNGRHANCGYVPEKEEDLYRKLYELYK